VKSDLAKSESEYTGQKSITATLKWVRIRWNGDGQNGARAKLRGTGLTRALEKEKSRQDGDVDTYITILPMKTQGKTLV